MKPPVKTLSALSLMLMGTTNSPLASAQSNSVSDRHIKEIVENVLREKDKKIESLEARIKQLESMQADTANDNADVADKRSVEDSVVPAVLTTTTSSNAKSSLSKDSILSQLGDLGDQIAELKESANENGLKISGFFDLNAKTDNSTDQTFSVGSVELDLEYDYAENFAASAAVVLCGNSAGVDSSAPAAIFCGGSGPGGLGGGQAGIAVALVDFHMFDHNIPPRGRIFNNQGFHFQAGRFDIPFSTDYQNFANTDRVTVTAPITTARMQFGGFNGDGVRSYGTWKFMNYSVFWTDAMFATDGTSVGGRLGMSFGHNDYRSHQNNPEGIEMGASYLGDLDRSNNLRHAVYGLDLSLGYGFLRLQNELMYIKAYENLMSDTGTDFGKPNQLGFHSTLLADLKSFIGYPVVAFVRYGQWETDAAFIQDYDGTFVRAENLSALSLGLNYRFNDFLKLKLEYTDSLGTSTKERFFDKQVGIAQMVVSF